MNALIYIFSINLYTGENLIRSLFLVSIPIFYLILFNIYTRVIVSQSFTDQIQADS
jgi:hypothetical protein